MKTWLLKWRGWIAGEGGATVVEYALIVAGLAVVIIASLYMFGDEISGMFSTFTGRLSDVRGGV